MNDDRIVSRRAFLSRLGCVTISLGAAPTWLPRVAFAKDLFAGGVWLAGDHHIHTKYSPDGQYEIVEQVRQAARHGLSWCVITDHGGPRHDKVALEQAYPELLAARKAHAGMHIFQGLEWNVPDAEHGSVILPPTPDEAKQIARFEVRFDNKNISKPKTPANSELAAVAGVKYLQSIKGDHKPLFFVNHPARTGRTSPLEMRNWADAGPDVTRGFEATAGHQAASLMGAPRGHYDKAPGPGSFDAYPKEAYRTWGGYDWFVAKVGGLWDSLLGEGRPWYITANSDSHRHHTDHTVVSPVTFATRGHVTPTTQSSHEHVRNMDFWPGEYTKTWVYARRSDPFEVLSALRGGSMFTVHGDLVDRLEMHVNSADGMAPMGGSLLLEKPGARVELRVRLREPARENFGGRRPKLDHVDVIVGEIRGSSADRALMTNETTQVVRQVRAIEMEREGPWLVFSHRFDRVDRPMYVRLRGTNRDVAAPEMDPAGINPWDDLWFYGNPVFIRFPKAG